MSWQMVGCPQMTGLAGEVLLDATWNGGTLHNSYSAGRIICDYNTASGFAGTRLRTGGGHAILSSASYVEHVRITGMSISAAPSATAPLLVDTVGGAPTFMPIQIETDRTIGIYDGTGALLKKTTGKVPTPGTEIDLDIIIDCGIGTCAKVVYYIYINGALDTTYNTTQTLTTYLNSHTGVVGFGVFTASTYGFTLSVNQVFSAYSTSTADLPYNAGVPKWVAVGGNSVIPASAEATFNWTNSSTASPNTWQDIDETGAHSGDTGSIWDSQTSDPKTAHDALYTYSAANPIPSGKTVWGPQLKHWQKLLGAGKDAAHFALKYSTTTEIKTVADNTISTSYAPQSMRWPARPGGGAWTRSDAAAGTVAFGAESVVAAGVDTGPRIDKMMIEWIYYSSSLPLATNPCVTSLTGTASVVSASTVTAAARVRPVGTIAVIDASTIAASAQLRPLGAASVVSASMVAAVARVRPLAVATMVSASSVSATARVRAIAAAAVVSASVVAATARVRVLAAVGIISASTVTVAGSLPGSVFGAIAIIAQSAAAVAGRVRVLASAAIAAASSVTATGSVPSTTTVHPFPGAPPRLAPSRRLLPLAVDGSVRVSGRADLNIAIVLSASGAVRVGGAAALDVARLAGDLRPELARIGGRARMSMAVRMRADGAIPAPVGVLRVITYNERDVRFVLGLPVG